MGLNWQILWIVAAGLQAKVVSQVFTWGCGVPPYRSLKGSLRNLLVVVSSWYHLIFLLFKKETALVCLDQCFALWT